MSDDHLYEQVANEIDAGQLDRALWTKSFSKSGGDEQRTKARYIKERVSRLKDEARQINRMEMEGERELDRQISEREDRELEDKIIDYEEQLKTLRSKAFSSALVSIIFAALITTAVSAVLYNMLGDDSLIGMFLLALLLIAVIPFNLPPYSTYRKERSRLEKLHQNAQDELVGPVGIAFRWIVNIIVFGLVGIVLFAYISNK